jgi:hypothetical protein
MLISWEVPGEGTSREADLSMEYPHNQGVANILRVELSTTSCTEGPKVLGHVKEHPVKRSYITGQCVDTMGSTR